MGWFITAVILIVLAFVGVAISRSAGVTLTKTLALDQAEKLDYEAKMASDKGAFNRYQTGRKDHSKEIEESENIRNGFRLVSGFLAIVAIIFLLLSMVYRQGVGEAKVIVNFDGTVAGENLDPGFGIKAPWQKFSNWDLFSQEAVFAGNGDGTPSYSGGAITGYEISTAVARGAQTNFDLSLTYTLKAEKVTPLYKKYRDQERFTKQVVEKSIVSVVRDIPTQYTPVEFRGEARGEATDKMFKALTKKLQPYGVDIELVNLQNIRYTEEVEASIRTVEVAQQKEETAAAELRSATVTAQTQVMEAEAKATADITAAQGTAEANRLKTASLTPEILQQNYIDALKKGTVFVVPEGSTPLITTSK